MSKQHFVVYNILADFKSLIQAIYCGLLLNLRHNWENIYEMTDLADANEEFLVDKHQAFRENVVMSELGASMPPNLMQPTTDPATGEQLPPQIPQIFIPHSYDNHEAHIEYHNNFRKSQEFDEAPDIVKQIFEHHVMLHQQALMGGFMPTAGLMGQKGPIIGGPQNGQQTMPFLPQSAAVGTQNNSEPPPPGGETTTPSQTQPPGQGN